MSVYATTASNAFESSWGTYCPGMVPGPGPEYTTCLGDLYSVAFLENRCVLVNSTSQAKRSRSRLLMHHSVQLCVSWPQLEPKHPL